MLSQSIENFLKSIYELQIKGETDWVSTNALAKHLGHAPASVTNMIKKLSSEKSNLLEYVPYSGARLTESGRRVALEILRHHRLIELYLSEALGVPWDKVHEEAEKLEHVISEDLEERMAQALGGDPEYDPHGSPIPSKDLKIPVRNSKPLADVEPGTLVEIQEVSDHDPALLRYLGELGLYPKTKIEVVSKEPFGNSLIVKKDNKEINLGEEAIRYIAVA